MQNAAPLYFTIKKIQRFEDRVIWRVYGRFSRTITRDYAVFFSRDVSAVRRVGVTYIFQVTNYERGGWGYSVEENVSLSM